jgi:molybdenum cofactor cytidylyltransferase
MKFGALPLEETSGKLLAHQVQAADGKKLFGKGHLLTAADVAHLREHGFTSLVVVTLEAGDMGENEAARRVGAVVVGEHVRMTAPGVGRANLTAQAAGILRINVGVLERLNNIDEGITIATLATHSLVSAGQLVGLVKIIPYAVAAARVADVEAIARENQAVLSIRPLQACSVGIIVTGAPHQRDKLTADFVPPLQTRIEKLGSRLDSVDYVAHTEAALAAALMQQQLNGRDVILVAGISATIDRQDVIPTALYLAQGSVAHFGVPVDPGNLLMLGYIGQTAVVGAPSCAKSYKTNVIDLILPRLLAGERLTRADLVALGHGGLLEDIAERPMPRRLDSTDATP